MNLAFLLMLNQAKLLISPQAPLNMEKDSFNTKKIKDSIKDGDGLKQETHMFFKVS